MRNRVISLGLILMIFFSAWDIAEKNTLDVSQTQNVLNEAVTAYGIYAKTQEEAVKAAFDAEHVKKRSDKNGNISTNNNRTL